MKQTLSLLVFVLISSSLAAEDIPAGYYSHINGLSDSTLKSALHDSISGGVRYNYGNTTYHSTNNPPEWMAGDLKAYGTWQAFPETDIREDGSIWDMYSNSVRYYPAKQGESGCSLNIEHCFPKSWWGGAENAAYKDLYHLNPSDQRANGQKSNYPPGHMTKADKFDNGSFKMAKAASSTCGYICFEPAPEYRGDFARAYFYIATAYEDYTWVSGTSPFNAANAMDNDSYLEIKPWLIQVLLDWHRSDPVSDKEICRADRISSIQHNRNPFIDYPELVEYIWGNRQGQTVNLDSLTCTAGTAVCTEYIAPVDTLHLFDTLINLPAITAALVNAVEGGSANAGIQSNGSSSITMGKSSTEGEIAFSGLNLADSAILVFRASPYNSATSMQIDIYAESTLIRSIRETVSQETRNEVRYQTTIPASTNSIRIRSVGTSTSKRACMQELYLLKRKPIAPTSVSNPQSETSQKARLVLRNGVLYILKDNQYYTLDGQKVR